MRRPSQSPHDYVLWILSNHCGKMEHSRLRRSMGIRYDILNHILMELSRDGRVRIDGEMISIL